MNVTRRDSAYDKPQLQIKVVDHLSNATPRGRMQKRREYSHLSQDIISQHERVHQGRAFSNNVKQPAATIMLITAPWHSSTLLTQANRLQSGMACKRRDDVCPDHRACSEHQSGVTEVSPVIGDDNKGINILSQSFNAFCCLQATWCR